MLLKLNHKAIQILTLQTVFSSNVAPQSENSHKKIHQYFSNSGTKHPYPYLDFTKPSKIQSYLDQATSIHALFRHGSRYPTTSKMNKQYKYFPDFDFPYKIDEQGLLSERGYLEHERLGLISKVFFENQNLDLDKIQFRSTHKPRAYTSMESFAKGANISKSQLSKISLIEPKIPKEIEGTNASFSKEYILRFFDRCCQNYKTVDIRTDSAVEKFLKERNIHEKDLIRMDVCSSQILAGSKMSVEVLINPANPKYTEILNCENIPEDLWFVNDFKHYYKTGYDNEINYKPSSLVLNNFLKKLEEDVSQSSFYFAHAETLIPLLTLLDIPKFKFLKNLEKSSKKKKKELDFGPFNLTNFKNNPKIKNFLKTLTYPDTKSTKNSKIFIPDKSKYFWNTTEIAPMAGNIMFVLNANDDRAVIALNEEIIEEFESIGEMVEFLKLKSIDGEEVQKLCACDDLNAKGEL